MNSNLKMLNKTRSKIFLSLAGRMIPDIEKLDEKGKNDFLLIIDNVIAIRPPNMQRLMFVFLALINLSPVFLFLRPFTKLSGKLQDWIIRRFLDSPISAFRAGMWGMKMMVLMGYYGNPALYDKFNYTPSMKGNERLHG